MKSERQAKPTELRLGLTLVIVLIVISSSIVIFTNSVVLVARSNSVDTSGQHSGFSLADKSTPPVSPANVSPLDSDFTTQAAISSLTARPTNNIVNTNSFYDVVFLTPSTGTIKTIEVTFPAGTTVPPSAYFNEAEGVGPGTVSKSGQTITYTVNNAVSIPAGTKIRLEFANINNPINPGTNFKVTVTTRNGANAIIDGPTDSTAYTIKQIGTNDIADRAISSAAIATSFAYQREVADGVNGWDPNSATTTFFVDDPLITSTDQRVLVNLDLLGGPVCSGIMGEINQIVIDCTSDPADGTTLRYAVFSPASL